MRTSLVLLALACGLAVCAAQLMNAAVTSTATAVSTATSATVTYTSTKGQAAAASNSVNLPCFSQVCSCTGNGVVAVAAHQVSWTTPTASCPVSSAGTASGISGTKDYTVTNTFGPSLLTASPAFIVTASTTSAANSLIVDNAGSGIAPAALGGNTVALTGGLGTITAADLKSGAVTAANLVFNFVTAIAVPISGKIIVNLPYNYLQTQSLAAVNVGTAVLGSCPVVNTAADPTACPPVTASATITCTIGTAVLPTGAGTLSFAAGWKSGDPAVTGGYSVYTTMPTTGSIIEGPAATSTLQQFTKGAPTTAPTFAFQSSSDLTAQLQVTTGTFTLAFTTGYRVEIGNQFVLTTPLAYFRTLAFTSSTGTVDAAAAPASGTAACVKTATTSTSTTDVWTCTTLVGIMPAGPAITWVSAGGSWNVLSNQAAGTFSVMTQTLAGFVIDAAVSSAAGGAPAIVSAPGTMVVSAITSASFSQQTDMNPGLTASTGTLTIAGITSSIVLVAVQSVLVFTFPYQYIRATTAAYTTTGGAGATGFCTTVDTAPVAACPPATGTAGFTTMTCTIAAHPIAAIAHSLILTTNWRIASNTASGTFTLQAMTSASSPRGVISVVSSGAAVPATGSTVTSVAAATNSVTAVPGDKLPGITTTGTLTLGVTPANLLSPGSTIVFTLPAKYLSTAAGGMAGATISTSSATVTCTLAQASAVTDCAAAGTTSTISCITGNAVIPSGAVASVTFAAGTWSLAKEATGTYTATTYNSLGLLVDKTSGSAALITAAAPGAVSSVQAAVFSKSTDQVPGLATTTGTLTFTFTTATTIPSGSIAIVFQSERYLASAGAFTTTMGSPSGVGPSGTCTLSSQPGLCAISASVTNCGVSSLAVAATQTLTCPISAPLTAGVVTLVLTAGSYTVDSSQPASKYTVSTSTTVSIDAAGTTMGNLPALAAGAVSAVSTAAFSVAGDMVPGTTSTGTLTFGFTTATDLISGAFILVTLPAGYLSTATSAKLGTATINCGLAPLSQGCAPTTTTSQLMTCTTTAAVTKGAQSLVLQIGGFVVGTKNAAAGTSYKVATATASGVIIDTAGSGSVPAITAGGSASGSGTAAASLAADLVPGTTTTGTLTLAFTTATAVPMTNGKVIFSLTPGYLRTAAAATLTGGSTTSTCSTLSLTAGSAATGCTAAVMDTITCTVGTANLAAGTYNLVLTAGQWSVGTAQPVGTFSVSTTNNNVVLDAASTTTGALPVIGSTVAVTSFTATVAADLAKIGVLSSNTLAIAFTTSTNLAASSFIQFTLPAASYLTAVTSAAMTGKDTTAPTCTLPSSTVLKCVFNAALPSGATIITLAAGWVPGATVNSAQFPTIGNFNKATYTISNLKTPSKYLPAATYAVASNNYQAYFTNECSATLAFQQFGTAPPSPSPSSPGASSGKALALSALLALSCCITLFLF